jgi:hypothetical protein
LSFEVQKKSKFLKNRAPRHEDHPDLRKSGFDRPDYAESEDPAMRQNDVLNRLTFTL